MTLISYLPPFLIARRVNNESKIILVAWSGYRFISEGLFIILSFTFELFKNNSIALQLNFLYVFLVNLIISALFSSFIKIGFRGRNPSGKTNEFWLSKNTFSETHILILALFFFGMYVFLTNGEALLNPRSAYQNFRVNIGYLWAGYIMLTSLWIVLRVVNSSNNFITIIVALPLVFFSGSKGILFSSLLPFFSSPKISIKNKLRFLYFIFPLVAFAFLVLFDQIHAEQNILVRFSNYFDMFHNSARVFEDYLDGFFIFQYGKFYLSSFWQYVPRIFFEGKPFSWGASSLVGYYYPGLAETGVTPSFGPYIADFADFGWFGFLTVIFSIEKIMTFIAIYIVSKGFSRSWKLYFICYAFLVSPGLYFHIPVLFMIPAVFLLLKFTKSRSHHFIFNKRLS